MMDALIRCIYLSPYLSISVRSHVLVYLSLFIYIYMCVCVSIHIYLLQSARLKLPFAQSAGAIENTDCTSAEG